MKTPNVHSSVFIADVPAFTLTNTRTCQLGHDSLGLTRKFKFVHIDRTDLHAGILWRAILASNNHWMKAGQLYT